jgi:hypothetical protein
MSIKRLAGWIAVYTAIILLVLGTVVFASYKIRTNKLPVGYVDLSLNKISYNVGEPVIFTISNHLSSQIYLNNNCPDEPLSVYKWVNGAWVPVHSLANKKLCEDQPRKIVVPEESSVSGDYNNWPELFKEPGKYKIEVVIFNYNARPYQELLVNKPAPAQNKSINNAGSSKGTPAPSTTPTPTFIRNDDD